MYNSWPNGLAISLFSFLSMLYVLSFLPSSSRYTNVLIYVPLIRITLRRENSCRSRGTYLTFPIYLITLNIRLTVLLLIDRSFSILDACIYLITTL